LKTTSSTPRPKPGVFEAMAKSKHSAFRVSRDTRVRTRVWLLLGDSGDFLFYGFTSIRKITSCLPC